MAVIALAVQSSVRKEGEAYSRALARKMTASTIEQIA